MMRKRVLNSPRLKSLRRKKRENWKKRIIIALVVLVCVLIGLTLLSRWSKLAIQTIEISGNKVVEATDIEASIREGLSGNYFFFLPKANFVLVPSQEIVSSILSEFSRIKSVDMKNKGTNVLEVEVFEYMGEYLWCGEEPLSDTETRGCYYLDRDGYIFDNAPYFSGEVFMKFFGSLDKDRDTIGQYFMEDYLHELIKFKELATLAGVEPVSFHLDELGDVNMYLTSRTTDLGPRIIFKKGASYQELAENLDTIMRTDSFRTDFTEKYSSLLYIDLRFGNKVYYKFSEE